MSNGACPIKFGTDGWRAIIADEFTFDNVAICAQATADYVAKSGLASRGVVVGYDTRFQADAFADIVAQVLTANEIPVYLCENPAPTEPATTANVVTQPSMPPRIAAGR